MPDALAVVRRDGVQIRYIPMAFEVAEFETFAATT
jgi:hypothetical protein